MVAVPTRIPINKAVNTSLKIKANNIAISGGIIENHKGIGFIFLWYSKPETLILTSCFLSNLQFIVAVPFVNLETTFLSLILE